MIFLNVNAFSSSAYFNLQIFAPVMTYSLLICLHLTVCKCVPKFLISVVFSLSLSSCFPIIAVCGPGERSRYSDSLQAERYGDRIPPIPVAERSKARICGRSLTGIAGSNPAGGVDVCVVCVVE